MANSINMITPIPLYLVAVDEKPSGYNLRDFDNNLFIPHPSEDLRMEDECINELVKDTCSQNVNTISNRE
jgi:hypothetical protein